MAPGAQSNRHIVMLCGTGFAPAMTTPTRNITAYYFTVTAFRLFSTTAALPLVSTFSTTAEHISFVLYPVYLFYLKPLCLSMLIISYV